MLLQVVDIETTGQAPPAENIEFGRVDVHRADSEWQIGRPMTRLYRPLNGIPPETMAVHHITEMDMTPDTPVCTADRLRRAVWSGDAPDGLVAHNSSFEQMFIAEDVTDALPWICTYKVALHVWPDAPRHSNQVLRYWRNLVLDPALAMPPHRAGPDAYVTACLLVELLRHATVDQMVAWTAQPKQLPKLPFGKHRGLSWAEAPLDYLQWMMRQTEMDKDAVWCAGQEVARRTDAS